MFISFFSFKPAAFLSDFHSTFPISTSEFFLKSRIHQLFILGFGEFVAVAAQQRQDIHETQIVADQRLDVIGDFYLPPQ